MGLIAQGIDDEGPKNRIRRTIANLESAVPEKQRPIFSNLCKFIEIQPTKIRIGMYAPAKSINGRDESDALKATGTDGLSTQNSNSGESKEGTVIPFDPNRRAGSSTVGSGAEGGI